MIFIMKRVYNIIVILISILFLSAVTPDSLKQDSVTTLSDSIIVKQPVNKKIVYPEIENKAFNIGEKLHFKIRYGFIRAGSAVMEVKREEIMDMRPVYHIKTTAQSASGFNWFFKVEDEVNSYMDKWGLFSWKFEKKLREGGYKVDILVDYDPFTEKAYVDFTRYHSDMTLKEKKSYDVDSPAFTFDILAAFYYIRNRDLKVGESVFLTTHDEKKVYELEVRVYKEEILDVKAGKFRCLMLEPLLKGEGIFKQKGRLQVWMTNDKYKIPVQMTSKIIVGHITSELEKIEGFAGPIPAQLDK